MMDRRKRGAAQKAIARCLIEHKHDHNGNSPTWEELASLMGYKQRTTARNIVQNAAFKNRPGRPFYINIGEPYGRVWLDIDEHGRPTVYPGEFVVEQEQQPLWKEDEFSSYTLA